ncbi:TIGR02466 family protein [Asticcacaulis sp. ZE23SCel15]|uniref:TIGR02466 family protein n=1 Tax=Asticcacaulis sp. ZE23SCel15 TaxID=3059027 RepID=UPI00265FFD1E|nr:TIGR02466 family protein [Asticcacaulis sp. ZE23SCel15]WKL56361.1 TIGR02466 family protein [Asticcacaulis sp. ZE23SCel15]
MRELPAAATLTPLFVTEIYRTELGGTGLDSLIVQLDKVCEKMASQDAEGKGWADRQGYIGYTSYGSIDDLAAFDLAFADLKSVLNVQMLAVARMLEMDLRGGTLELTNMWVNRLAPGGAHTGHIHPHSVFSGTLYINVPNGSGALQFEDPRLGFMMHAPMRTANARPHRQISVPIAPQRGTLLIWESWLRHEVATNRAATHRTSISFNYDLKT